MRICSLNIRGKPAEGRLDGRLEKGKIIIDQRVEGFLKQGRAHHEFSVRGSTVHLVDGGSSTASAFKGAAAGGLLAGGLGALVGGALGAGRKHSLSVHTPDAIIVLEVSTPELQELAGVGVVPGQTVPGDHVAEIGTLKAPSPLPGCVLLILVGAGILAWRACSKDDGAPRPPKTVQQQAEEACAKKSWTVDAEEHRLILAKAVASKLGSFEGRGSFAGVPLRLASDVTVSEKGVIRGVVRAKNHLTKEQILAVAECKQTACSQTFQLIGSSEAIIRAQKAAVERTNEELTAKKRAECVKNWGIPTPGVSASAASRNEDEAKRKR